MNNKYDTNGFADLINEIKIEPSLNELTEECSKYGGSVHEFKHMITLKFQPIDEFQPLKGDEQINIEQVDKEIQHLMSAKCSGPHDTDVEPINELELHRFTQLMGTKKAC